MHTKKISRNAPRPKKYKRCRGADVQPYDGPSQGSWAEQLTQAIEASDATTLDEMNVIAQQMSVERNARPIQEFLGLSPEQRQACYINRRNHLSE